MLRLAALMHAEPRTSHLATCLLGCALVIGCHGGLDSNITRYFEANRLATGLQVHFTKASDASNRVVMADTDEAVGQAAAEAKQETDTVARDMERLSVLLKALHASDELELLAQFRDAFAKYRALDREVLALASASTNLKAQRLSFGPAQAAADAVRDALEPARGAGPRQDWHERALADEVVLAVREIQALQAPHIAESQDLVMDALEKRMAASMQAAHETLAELSAMKHPELSTAVDAANAALAHFADLNAQLVQLSRTNSNVRSLALSLGQKRVLTATCEARLRALAQLLAQRRFTATR